MTKLLIVESPNKAKKIASFLDREWIVKASFGHVRDLPKKVIGVEAPYFRPTYEIHPDKAKTISELKKLCASASHVFLATDPDREGEAIAWHLQEVLKLREPFRVTFNSVEKKTVLQAIAQPRAIDMNLVHAQEGRRVCDRLVGYMVSPLVSNAAGKRLSAGRVQSVALLLVVERERAIRKFVSTAYFEVEITLENGLKMKLRPQSIAPDCERIIDRNLAEVIAAASEVVISRVETKPQSIHPKPAFTTSTLQQSANASFKMSAADTMKVAQSLFENGHITYHRTDDPNLSADAYEQVCAWLRDHGFPHQPVQRRWQAKGNAQEAHEAIRPTDFNMDHIAGTADEQRVYKLIRDRAIRSQMLSATEDVTIVEAQDLRDLANEQGTEFNAVFLARARKETQAGFRAYTTDEKEEKDGEENQLIPVLPEEGALHQIEHAQVLDKKTQPPKRYTEGTLVRELERLGIGRPSTYASILQNIIGREYLRVGDPEGKKSQSNMLFAQPLGELLTDALRPAQFLDPQFTNRLEAQLDDITGGKMDYLSVVRELHATVEKDLSMLNLAGLQAQATHAGDYREAPCPQCQTPLKRLPSKQKKGEFYWAHKEMQPDCVKFLSDEKGTPTLKRHPAPTDAACPSCGQAVRRLPSKQKVGEFFWIHREEPKTCSRFLPDDNGHPGKPKQRAMS